MTPVDASPRGWASWRNTHLQGPLWLFRSTVKDEDYDSLLKGQSRERRTFRRKLAQRVFWFWPRIDDAAGWAESETGGHWSPTNYLREKPTRPAQRVIDTLATTDTLMELACNSGCDMDFVRRAGFTHLRGVDVSGEALLMFAELFPETWETADVSHDLIQRYLLAQSARSVDTIFSNGAAIELVHPSFPIVREMCRVARTGVILELDQINAGYPRDYVLQFRKEGFVVLWSTEDEDGAMGSHLYHFIRS